MKKLQLFLLAFILCTQFTYAKNQPKPYKQNEIIISLKEDYTLEDFYISLFQYLQEDNNYTKKNVKISDFSLEKYIKLLHSKKNYNNFNDLIVLKSTKLSSDELTELSNRFASVQSIEKNYKVKLYTTPNDTFYLKKWGLEKIKAPNAWDKTTGDSNVVVGVIDTGVDIDHRDLIDNIWINEIERNGQPGVDDDNNGYIDDIYGIDTLNNDSNPDDDNSHGTHCAGIIGATGNNALGVTGVNWNIKIAACKFIDNDGYGDLVSATECVNYFNTLKSNGINIVATNNSWGFYENSSILYDAFQTARDLGIIGVTAAGNNGASSDNMNLYPAHIDIDNIINVGSTDFDDNLSYFSNYGVNVDIAAPGSLIYSTIYGNAYDTKSGTSMAAPFVTGAIALLSATHPEYTYKEKIDAIINSSDKLTSLEGKINSAGRLNLNNLLNYNNAITPTIQKKIFPSHQYVTMDGLDFKEFDNSIHTITDANATLNGFFFQNDTQATIDITSNTTFNAYVYDGRLNKIISCIIEDGLLKVKGAYVSFGAYNKDAKMYNVKIATSDNDYFLGVHSLNIVYK